MKQTAVEFFVSELRKKIETQGGIDAISISKLKIQAKEMEREQIVDAYGSERYPCSDKDAEQYYNETYK